MPKTITQMLPNGMTRLWYDDNGEQKMKVIPTHPSQLRPEHTEPLDVAEMSFKDLMRLINDSERKEERPGLSN